MLTSSSSFAPAAGALSPAELRAQGSEQTELAECSARSSAEQHLVLEHTRRGRLGAQQNKTALAAPCQHQPEVGSSTLPSFGGKENREEKQSLLQLNCVMQPPKGFNSSLL